MSDLDTLYVAHGGTDLHSTADQKQKQIVSAAQNNAVLFNSDIEDKVFNQKVEIKISAKKCVSRLMSDALKRQVSIAELSARVTLRQKR